jgi:hypothetical protein
MKQTTNPVDLLLQKLAFLPEAIVEAAAEQSRLFMDAVDYRMSAMDHRIQAEAALAELEASKSLSIRSSGAEERITEGKIKAMLTADPKMQKFTQAFNQAERNEEYAKLLVDAYRMRRDCLRIVGELAAREMALGAIAEEGANKVTALRGKLKQKYPGESL